MNVKVKIFVKVKSNLNFVLKAAHFGFERRLPFHLISQHLTQQQRILSSLLKQKRTYLKFYAITIQTL